MSTRVSLPSLYAVPERSLGDHGEQNNAASENNDIVPRMLKKSNGSFDTRKDISDYFGLDDFLLRVYVTSGLQYAFDDQAVGVDSKKLGVMKSSFLKFLHKRLYFFSSMLHIAYGFVALGILLHNAGSTCRTEPDVSFCSTKSIFAGAIMFSFSILNFIATRSNDYMQASLRSRALLHTTYFIQGMTLVVVEILSPFPKYFRVTLHLAFGYSFFPLDPLLMLKMNAFLLVAYGGGCLAMQGHWESSSASISRLGMNILVVCILFVLQASAQYYRQINMMRSELSYAKSKWQQRLLVEEKHKCSELLLSMLPAQIIERLDEGSPVEPELFKSVTVIFGQVCNFTQFTTIFSAVEVVSILNEVWSNFDRFSDMWGVHKIETVGEIYLAVSGCPIRSPYHAQRAANMALDMRDTMAQIEAALQSRAGLGKKMNGISLKVRVGLNSGAVQAGIVGLQNPRYKLFGDTVNTSSRMESTCPHGKIQVSSSTYALLSDASVDENGNSISYKFEDRGMIDVKGKGEMHTYILLENGMQKGSEILSSPQRMLTLHRKQSLKSNIKTAAVMHKLQNRSSQREKYAEREQGFNKYMTTHGSVAGNKDVKGAYVVDVDEDGVKDAEVEKKKNMRHKLSFRMQRVLLLIEKDDQSFNAELMSELQRSRPFFKESNWDHNVKSVRMVASFFIFFTSVIAWNQFAKTQSNQHISPWETPIWFGVTSPAMGLYIFLSLNHTFFHRYGQVLTWILLTILLAVLTFTSLYVIMDGTLILIILLVALNIQLVDIDKRVCFVVFGLIPYPLIYSLSPPQNVSQEAAFYRNKNTIVGEVATCLLVLFLQFFPVYASEFFSQYSAYQQNIIVENTKQLSLQQEGKWDLLSCLLPLSIAKQLLNDDKKLIAQTYKDVTVLFTDIKGFTNFSKSITPIELVKFLNNMYSAFDDVLIDWEAYKVEILGDAYFVVCGCPEERSPTENAARATEVALILQSLMPSLTDDTGMMMRVGLHSGHVVAGVVGTKDPRFHLFGHTVLFANKMESHGLPGKVHISDETFRRLTPLVEDKRIEVEPRGEIAVQGEEGMHRTYFVKKSNWGKEKRRTMLMKRRTKRGTVVQT